MKVHNIQFRVRDKETEYKVEFDLVETQPGKKWAVCVTLPKDAILLVIYATNRNPTPANAKRFIKLYKSL